ncbi:hypothetical protein [Gymnodinialimonas sp.]
MLLVTVAAVGIWTALSASVTRDAPRELPWSLPDYREAKTYWEVGIDGRIYTQVEHFVLRDITPEMVAWFYQHLPISTVELRGEIMPLYHIFHPSEHGQIAVIEPASNGVAGMSVGAKIERKEWFGPYDSQGAARIAEFSSEGMLAIPEMIGIKLGEVQHRFRAVPEGTAYHVHTVIGSNLPLVGSVINWFVRNYVFHPAMLEQWQRHQVEEVSGLQFFLADIYSQRGPDNHFVIAE